MKKIKIDLYGQEVKLFESFDEIDRYRRKHIIANEQDIVDGMNYSAGFAGVIQHEEGQCEWFIALSDRSLVTLSHECIHVAYMMLDMVGIQHDVTNHEALCYLQHYIFEQCARKMKLIDEEGLPISQE